MNGEKNGKPYYSMDPFGGKTPLFSVQHPDFHDYHYHTSYVRMYRTCTPLPTAFWLVEAPLTASDIPGLRVALRAWREEAWRADPKPKRKFRDPKNPWGVKELFQNTATNHPHAGEQEGFGRLIWVRAPSKRNLKLHCTEGRFRILTRKLIAVGLRLKQIQVSGLLNKVARILMAFCW